MKIQCPKCGSIFQFNENVLQSNENRFRCYKCGYMWILDISKYNKMGNKPHDNTQAKKINKNTHSVYNFNFILFLVISIVTLFIIISFIFIANRTLVVKRLKRMSFPSINSKTILKTDLEIEVDIPIPTIRRDDKDLLMIKGRIINRTFKSQNVPPILIELKNKEKNILWHLVKKFHKNSIAPNSSEQFTFIIEKYSKTIANVNVRFELQKNK